MTRESLTYELYSCLLYTSAFFHLLDGKAFTVCLFQFRDSGDDFGNLFLDHHDLPSHRKRYLFKLGMSDDNRVVIPGRDTRTKLFSVRCFKVFFRCHKDIGRWIKLQKFSAPLSGQVVGYDKQALLTQPEPFEFHCRGGHLVGFASTHDVREQGMPALDLSLIHI